MILADGGAILAQDGPGVGGLAAGVMGLLIGAACLLTPLALVGALLLRLSCAVFNWLWGRDGDNEVPEPGFGDAFATVLLAGLVQTVLSALLQAAFASPAGASTAGLLVQLAILPASLLILAASCRLMLPTTFLKGLALAAMTAGAAYCVAVALIFLGAALGAVT